jgi:hypothetical protein
MIFWKEGGLDMEEKLENAMEKDIWKNESWFRGGLRPGRRS